MTKLVCYAAWFPHELHVTSFDKACAVTLRDLLLSRNDVKHFQESHLDITWRTFLSLKNKLVHEGSVAFTRCTKDTTHSREVFYFNR